MGPIDIVFLGVGFSGRNGTGFPTWLTSLSKDRVVIVDPSPTISKDRAIYLSMCGIDQYRHLPMTCWAFLGLTPETLPAGLTPTPFDVQEAYESERVAMAKVTEDPTVLRIITSIFAANEWREPTARRRRRPE